MITINNHILLPHPANWSTLVDWQRTWETNTADSVLGHESRVAVRATPRRQISFLLTPWSVTEQNRLDDRLRAAAQGGLACAPYWGRGAVLEGPVRSDSPHLSLDDVVWTWSIGDYIFLFDADAYPAHLYFDVGLIAGVDVDTDGGVTNLTLSANPSRAYPAGGRAWPMVFGEFSAQDMSAVTAQRGAVQVTLRELQSPEDAVVNGPVTIGSGLGATVVGSTFIVT
ncbi:MAG TPA: hypothetical protein VHB20_14700 [Verrucomicrobiae bacterium]|jgi:hypothetical protein|nr:hypothetical protein [Verrucomicrobiae bacterium]